MQARNLLAAALSILGKFEAAAEHWEQFAKARPKIGDAQTNLAEVYRVVKKYDRADEHGRLAVELEPESSAAHNNYEIILQEIGRLPAAMEHIDKAIELEPKFAKAHSNRGNRACTRGAAWGAAGTLCIVWHGVIARRLLTSRKRTSEAQAQNFSAVTSAYDQEADPAARPA